MYKQDFWGKWKKDVVSGFTIFLALVCIANLILNVVNGKFWLSDFKVYYTAAKMLASGGQIYLQSFMEGSGYYKYSPFTLLFFLPYTALNYTVASVIHFTILSLSFWYTFLIIRNILNYYFFQGSVKHEGLLLSLALICIMLHLVRELYLGNINIVLLMLSLLSLKSFIQKKHMAGGLLLGLVLLTKPFFLILFIPLILRRQWKALQWTCITIFAGLIIPFLFPGPERALKLYSGWFEIMRIHDRGFPGMNSLDYILQHYFFPSLPAFAGYFIILLAGLAVGIFVLRNQLSEKKINDQDYPSVMNFIFEWFLILSLIPNLVKTDSEHFLSATPLLVFIIWYISSSRRYWLIPVMIILIFFYGGNSYDLLGKDLSQQLFTMGLLGISNLLIILLSLILYLDFRRKKISIPGKAGIYS